MRRDSDGAEESSFRCEDERSELWSNVTEGVGDTSGTLVSSGDCRCSLVVVCCSFDGVRGGATVVASERWLYGRYGGMSLAGDLDWKFLSVACSSASSVISISLRRRRELEEEVIEPEAACNKHAEDSALSVRSVDLDSEKTVSWGENLSRTD